MGNDGIKVRLDNKEELWQPVLFQHCQKLFTGIFLPSHDHLHHSRVWSHARSILLLLDKSGISISDNLIEELIIAVYFHDVGLIKTPGEKHGLESRKLCEEFLATQVPGRENPDQASIQRILQAIEHHDDKSLKSGAPEISHHAEPDLLNILSASDDLDAFGLMGIYRFAEIYLHRGIKPEQLPQLVTANVSNRFENLKNRFGNIGDFLPIQEARFRQVFNFYLKLGQVISGRDEKPSWEPVLIEIIYDSLLKGQNLLLPDRILPENDFAQDIRNWFGMLDRENYFT